jgi:tetratricopeptide (TPR) repeat protein
MWGFALLLWAGAGHCHMPTPSEFKAWPDYCKTRYVRVPGGESSPYVRLVSQEMIRKAQAQLGDSWFHVHHACYSMFLISRAERQRGRNTALWIENLNLALAESNYAVLRIPPTNPVHWKMLTIQARILYERGNKAQGIDALKQIVRKQPDLADSYAVLGNFLYKDGKLDEARDVLQTGLEKVPKPTSEMHYFLGMILFKQGSFEGAREQAQKAYALGYPLPGLRNRLKAAGHW